VTDPRVGVVVITHNRRAEALAAVGRLVALPERPPVVLVDNASGDGTAEAVRKRFPDVDVVALPANQGAVGRNIGVARLRTPYIAFCDDDTCWTPGSLAAAADVLDACPRVAVVNARIVADPGGRDDPIVPELRDSPVPRPSWLPGPALGSFLALEWGEARNRLHELVRASCHRLCGRGLTRARTRPSRQNGQHQPTMCGGGGAQASLSEWKPAPRSVT